MPSVINTNNASLVAQRNLSNSQSALTTSIQRLSSGLRINSSKDDAAGLGISQVLQAQISGGTIAARNANDAISMVQTAEGGIQEVSTMLQRMRELAVQGNNDALSSTQMSFIGTEVNALRDEINKISLRTTFNGKILLNGQKFTATDVSVLFQTGTASTDTVDISNLMVNVTLTTAGSAIASFAAVNACTVTSSNSAGESTSVGTLMTELTTAIDTAAGTTGWVSETLQTSINYGLLVTAIDGGINGIATVRSNMGATQNQLEHNIANLDSQVENLTASMSRIRDTDYSVETAKLTKNQVMQQAATAMLAQANQMPNVVLSLLK